MISRELFSDRIEEQIVDIPVPPIVEEIAEVMSSSHAAAWAALTPVNVYVAPARDVAKATPVSVIECVAFTCEPSTSQDRQ